MDPRARPRPGLPLRGHYSTYLETKAARLQIEGAKDAKRAKRLKDELEWVRSGAKARQAKSKARLARYEEMAAEAETLTALRDSLRAAIETEIDGVSVNGPAGLRLPGNLNISFDRIEVGKLDPIKIIVRDAVVEVEEVAHAP